MKKRLNFQVIDDSSGELNKYYYKLGQHFVSLQDYKQAEKFYMKANMHKQASTLEMTIPLNTVRIPILDTEYPIASKRRTF
jgi:hypothetical protein